MSFPTPYILPFDKLGDSTMGYISVGQNDKLPFEVKRVFWTYHTPESIVRGRHAHHATQQILIAVTGRIIVTTESAEGKIETFILDSPDKGVYVPPNVWHTMQYSHTAIQVVLASTEYNEKDYIRNHEEFKKNWG
jgi:dTDP-4-dehydrorhamnose 3,5-epimerase-like enzyme